MSSCEKNIKILKERTVYLIRFRKNVTHDLSKDIKFYSQSRNNAQKCKGKITKIGKEIVKRNIQTR